MFRPMLSATVKDLKTDVIYTTLGSPKLDGIRAIVQNGRLYSRRMKLIPNLELVGRYGDLVDLEGLDGELIYGDPTAPTCFRRTTSIVMSRFVDAKDISFYVFDRIMDAPYKERLATVKNNRQLKIKKVLHRVLSDVNEAMAYEEECVTAGYEGIILRAPWQRYKQGRSTLAEQGMMKVKRFLDAEATVLDLEERMHNANEATKDERGYTKRSSHKANQHPTGVLGALVVQWNGMQFNIGTGFDDSDRAEIWKNRQAYLGKTVKFKYLPVLKDAPRHPVFLGWRED